MRNWVHILVALAIVTGFAAVASADDMSMGRSDPEVTATLQTLERKINEAVKNKDTSTFMSMVDPNAFSIDPMGLTPVSEFPEMMKDMEVRSYTIDSYKASMVSKDTYLATYVFKGDASYKGQAIPQVPTYCSTIWIRHGKEWKALFHQETPAMPGMTGSSMGGGTGH